LALSPGLRARVSALELALSDIEVGRVAVEDLNRIKLGRSTARYETALTLARLLLEHQAPSLRAGSTRVFALLFDMNQLWERYVTAMFRRAVPHGTVVHAQESRPLWRATGRPARLVRPDIVVRRDGEITLIADAKWKVYGGEPSIGELQQMFVYNEQWRSPRAVLIYPGRPSACVVGRFQSRQHTCDAVLLDALAKQPERELCGLLSEGVTPRAGMGA
jgi:5-methylcytosine-specific restriction enzyme subunit McrC